MMPTETISHEDFADFLNETFTVERVEPTLELELIEVDVRGAQGSGGSREPFTLIFAGPIERVLIEGLHGLRHEKAGRFDLYIMPIVSSGPRQSYQVIFN